MVGCELGGAVKNVIALACGIAEGLGFGDNTRASLITRGLAETARLGLALGAELTTFAGLAGLGDLVATCSSPLSRNRTFGEKLGRGMTLEEVQESTRQTAEGVKSCRSVLDLARAHDVDVPITEAVVRVCHEGEAPGADGAGDHDARGQAGVSAAPGATAPGRSGPARPPPVPGAPLRPSPVFAAPFHLGDQPPRAGGADAYARTEHPTLRDFEAAVGELDGGRCLSFATGMAAISAAVLACVGAGDRVVLPSDGYYTTRLLAARRAGALRRRGSTTCPRRRSRRSPPAAASTASGWCCWRRPSNPQLDVCDIAAVARAARAAGALVAVDNTTATPLGPAPAGPRRRPHRRQRHQGAHRAQRPAARPREHRPTTSCTRGSQGWRDHTGSTPGPVRGVARAPVDEHPGPAAGPAGGQRGRGRRAAGRRRPAVTGVRWPWRAGDPSYALAARQMLRPNGVVSAELADEAAVARCSRAPGCGPRRPASAACTARSTGGRSGAATRSRRGSSGSPAASRTPPTWSPT